MASGEQKQFGLRSARKPAARDGLLNLALVFEDGAPRYCYVQFSDAFISYVGKRLPQGVSTLDPAFLVVFFDKVKAVWKVIARYVERKESSVLWVSGDKPEWVKEARTITRYTHDNQKNRSTVTCTLAA